MTERILVIKLGALGDFVQALGPFAAIRRHHPDARITILTTGPYVELAYATGLFDQVWTDNKPRALQFNKWLDLRRRLRSGDFQRVYDLQTSDRSSFYRRLFWPGQNPQWSGIARGCSHPHANPKRDFMHTVERQAEQLQMAGIDDVPAQASIIKLSTPIDSFDLGENFALLVPGGAPHRPEKRWPEQKYAALADDLFEKGVTPVLLGGPAETESMEAIAQQAPGTINLCGKTSLLEIASIARRANFSVGNDTGPMHLIAGVGCASLVLYSHASDPALCAQRGVKVSYIRKPVLDDVSVDEVLAELKGPNLA
jgi:ADP-heptose:LPS heptosyltransferase